MTHSDLELAGPKAVGIDGDDAAPIHTPPAGDWRDDDGLVIDDALEPNPNPTLPDSFPAHLVPGVGYDDGPKQASRILSSAWVLPIASDPVQVLPADPGRKAFFLIASSTVPADLLKIAGQKTDVYGAGNWPMSQIWNPDGVTGAVWVYAPAATGVVTVSVWAVTE